VTDRIAIAGISGHGHHGVLAEERSAGQTFIVDVEYGITPAAGDDLTDTVDYATVAQITHDAIVGPPFDLIESLAQIIAERILLLSGVRDVVVTVHKPQAPIPVPFTDVSITVRRP
jgi:dihydroneopterin aldolase